jgi:hypothetical protein
MGATLFGAVSAIAIIYLISSLWDGIPVLRLPFEPYDVAFVRGMMRRGLKTPAEGGDVREASWLFVYVASNGLVRFLITRFLPNLSGAPKGVANAAAGGFGDLFKMANDMSTKMVGPPPTGRR